MEQQQQSEIWKPVLRSDHQMEVSDFGRVRRWYDYAKKWTIKKQSSSRGYCVVSMMAKGKKKAFKVHRLVLEAFTPSQAWMEQVNHKDGDKSNNCLENLEWCSPAENVHHAISSGLRKMTLGDHPKAKKVINSSTGKIYDCARQASVVEGVNYSTLRDYLNNRKPNKTNLTFYGAATKNA